ncbi:hypothetical protein, partial [Burkholderia gladioli]|uniref:hypothetical protein n=1 Tax=Burkholderia gladioli TaxID=28095 RepID=UPI001ABB3169
PTLRARQHVHHFLPGVSQKHSLMPIRYCKWVTVSGVSGGCSMVVEAYRPQAGDSEALDWTEVTRVKILKIERTNES